MTIYIVGPITGIIDDNRAAFESAKDEVFSRFPDAHIFIPHELYEPDRAARICPALCWTEAMAVCLPYAEMADFLVALPGWQKSRGARREIAKCREWVEYEEIFR